HTTQAITVPPGKTTIQVRFRRDFGMDYPYAPPQLGATSRGLKFISQTWNTTHDRLDLQVAGAAGTTYDVPLYGDLAGLSVNGGKLDARGQQRVLRLTFPPGPPESFSTENVTLSFAAQGR